MATSTLMLPIALIVDCTEAEGPGRRTGIWLQGCPLRCPGCCNPEMLPFRGGTPTSIASLFTRILRAARQQGVEGVSLLGGEPSSHAAGCGELAARLQAAGLSVMVYSGFRLAELKSQGPEVGRLLKHTDLLVDGPYLSDLPETSRRWIGSSNQELHFLSDRYAPTDPRFQQKNTLEIRYKGGEMTLNGFPAAAAASLWRKPPEES